MIITLIKNAEIVKNEFKPTEITHTGASDTIKNAMILLHFCGKRPLYVVEEKGEYVLNFPQKTLPLPDLILTGKESYSNKTGRIINEIFTNNDQNEIKIESGTDIYYPQKFLKKNPQVSHLVIVGSEACLNKWACLLGKEGQKRTTDSSFSVFSEGEILFDAEKNSKLYLTEGIMDTLLVRKVYENPDNLPKDLKPFAKKLKQLPPTEFILSKINQKS